MQQPESLPSDPRVRSLLDALRVQVKARPDAPALRYLEQGSWRSWSWREWEQRARQLAAALLSLGLQPGDTVALLAASSAEWAVVDVGVQLVGGVLVPIYPSSTAEQVALLLADCGAKLVVCQDEAQLAKVGERRSKLPALESLVSLLPAQLLTLGQAELERQGAELEVRRAGVGADSLATLLYTSGTTGAPKGVMLTQGNLVYVARAAVTQVAPGAESEQLLVLPLAHIMARSCLWQAVMLGIPSAIDAELTRTLEYAQALRPTVLNLVPRLLEKVAAALRGAPAARVQAAFGGRLRQLYSGGAALSPAAGEFLVASGLAPGEGYGLTEAGGAVTLRRPGESRVGSVGRPLPGTEIRLAADGEVLVSGPGVMLGYYRRPEETREALRELDGRVWLHTGDVGRLDDEGNLWLTDRKKDLFKTSGGKYIAPQQLENLLKAQSPLLSQVVICGDERQYVTALLTLDAGPLSVWAREQGLDGGSAELARQPALLRQLQSDIDAVNASLAPFETIKRFRILPADFTIAGGELTPTVKLRRRAISQKYRELIDEMYGA